MILCFAGWNTWMCAQTPPVPPPVAVPSVMVLATDPTALLGTSSGAFTLLRSGPTNADLAVNLTISGTASNGVNYQKIADVVTIPAGFLAVDVPIVPIMNGDRGNKTVIVTAQTNASYSIGPNRRATITIVDDIFNLAPPTITLTSPTNGSIFAFPASITLEADASDLGVRILSVSFYANDDLLGRVTSSPYSMVWTNGRPGQYLALCPRG